MLLVLTCTSQVLCRAKDEAIAQKTVQDVLFRRIDDESSLKAEVRDLIKQLVRTTPSERAKPSDVIVHPARWTNTFLMELVTGTKKRLDTTTYERRVELEKALNKLSPTVFGGVGTEWLSKLPVAC